MNHSFSDDKSLQPPGAGLPAFERFALNSVLKSTSAVLTDKFVLRWIQKDATELAQMADCEDESYDVMDAIMTPRLIGIEDSSRKWSVLMVLEHLCLANGEMIKLIQALANDTVPRGAIDIALYKPTTDVDYEVISRFRTLSAQYANVVGTVIAQHGNLHLPARYTHPWFGSMNAHQWHCLVAYHQRIHKRQMKKIIAMLGVA